MNLMPFAVALLCHPAGAYGFFVVTLAAFVYAYHTRSFVPGFTAASAGALTTLAFLQLPPDSDGVLRLVLGVVLLQCEFLVPTYGAALLAGLAASFWGSWLLLAPPGATPALAPAPRLALALAGTAALLASVLRGFRLRTLPAR
jgi:membrane-bound ClpP family serine protease